MTDADGCATATSPWLAAKTLCWREIVRFFRQRNRVIGALGQPILFWLLFGMGLSRSFRMSPDAEGGQSFLEYYFPGTLVLILLFTAIFATISIIEDRREGFLQSVLVAPVPRWSMVLGKVMGGSLIALMQGIVFLLLAAIFQLTIGVQTALLLVLLLFVSALALTSLGFVLAWRMESTQGFHAIMNLLLMPMWLLSGAFFPVPPLDGTIAWSQVALHWCMRINPVTYCVAGVRRLVYDDVALQGIWTPQLETCWLVTGCFAGIMFAAACWIAGKRTTGDLL
ncbi:MAG: ABC transporter permease [Planctomycetes bacterium]|nr:ABC transporter permease [Planctomycetota bacterium]